MRACVLVLTDRLTGSLVDERRDEKDSRSIAAQCDGRICHDSESDLRDCSDRQGRAGQGREPPSISMSNSTRTPPAFSIRSATRPERSGQGTDRSPGIKRTPLRLNLVVGFQAALSVRYRYRMGGLTSALFRWGYAPAPDHLSKSPPLLMPRRERATLRQPF